uniref:hypothetical protein n=1 Tax=Flavobacterium sp. TaxID=239 RepID=UPI004048E609
MRTVITKDISHFTDFKNQLLHWANQHREVVFLDSNQYHQQYSSYDAVLAVDAFTSIKTDYENAIDSKGKKLNQVVTAEEALDVKKNSMMLQNCRIYRFKIK